MEKYNLKNKTDIKMHNVLFATTSERDYDMERLLLLEDMPDTDYKGVLKENEELLQEKINNQKIIALAQNNMLNYQAGFEDGKNGRTSAVQSIIENQQYYIFQKQIEKYERHIEKLQKENEELKYKYNKALSDVIAGVDLDNTYISKQKVKDKISERQFELQQEYKDFEDDSILIVLQELLEGRK